MRTPLERRSSSVLAGFAVLVFAAVAALPRGAGAGLFQLDGSIDVGYSETVNDGVDEEALRQRYTLLLSRSISDYLDTRFSLRYFRFDVDSVEELGVFREEIQPTGEIVWSHPWFRFSTSATRRIVESPNSDGELVTDNLTFDWKSTADTWPIFSARYDIRTNEDTGDSSMLDTEDRRFLAGVDIDRANEALSYYFTDRRTENLVRGLESEEQTHQLQYNGNYRLDDAARWTLGAQYVFGHRNTTDQVRSGARLLEQVPIANGLYAFDATPDLDALDPLPALVDGNTAGATSIDVGAGSADENIGADLGIPRGAVAAIYLYTDRPSGPELGFRVYVSDDNLSWTLIDASPAVVFNLALQRYEIEFSPVATRYVKVVSDAQNPVPEVFVTEIQVLEFLAGADEIDRSATSHQASARLGFEASESVDLSLDTSVRRDPGTGTLEDRTAADAALRMVWRQGEAWIHNARVEQSWQLAGDDGFDDIREDFGGWTSVYTPLPTLSTSASLTGRQTFFGSRRGQETLSLFSQVNAEPLSSLFMGLEGVLSRTNELIGGRQSDNWIVRSNVDAEVTDQLRLLSNWTHQETFVDPMRELRVRRTWSTTADLRLSSTIFLRAGLLWNDDDGRFSRSQDYLASWRILPRASITASATLNDATGGVTTDRITVNATIDVNPRTTAYFTYSDLEQRTAAATRLESWLVGLRSSF